MAEADVERWKLLVAAISSLSAVAALAWGIIKERQPKVRLTLSNLVGKKDRWGHPEKGDWTYFYHIKVNNQRRRKAENIGVKITKISKALPGGAFSDANLAAPVELKWAYKENTATPTRADIARRDFQVCNLGHIIQPFGYFQLNVLLDPLPPECIVHVGEKMRVETRAENADSNRLCVEIDWRGPWDDDPVKMSKNLIVEEV